MSGSRRVQRSVRVTVAVGLVALGALGVAVSVLTATAVPAAAVVAAVTGVAAARIMHTEVVQTRRYYAREKAVQAQSFGAAIAHTQAGHIEFTRHMSARLADKDLVISQLTGTVRLAEARADEAEARVRREARRATDAQARLSELLDEVLAYQAATAHAEDTGGRHAEHADDATPQPAHAGPIPGDELVAAAELPTIVDLLAWEERVVGAGAADADLRKHA